MGKKFGFSFSWKRAIGISAAKARISRKIGIPLTRSGRERKLGRLLGGFPIFGGRSRGVANVGSAANGDDDTGGGCCGCLVWLIAGVIVWGLISAYVGNNSSTPKAESISERSQSEDQPKPAALVANPQTPAPLHPDPQAIEAAKLLAVKYHPALGVRGSPLNKEFVTRYKRYQTEKPAFFDNPSWPLVLTEECVQALKATP